MAYIKLIMLWQTVIISVILHLLRKGTKIFIFPYPFFIIIFYLCRPNRKKLGTECLLYGRMSEGVSGFNYLGNNKS